VTLDRVRSHRVAIVPDVISKDTVAELRATVLAKSNADWAAKKSTEAIILDGENRWHGMPSVRTPSVRRLLRELGEHDVVRPLLEKIFGRKGEKRSEGGVNRGASAKAFWNVILLQERLRNSNSSFSASMVSFSVIRANFGSLDQDWHTYSGLVSAPGGYRYVKLTPSIALIETNFHHSLRIVEANPSFSTAGLSSFPSRTSRRSRARRGCAFPFGRRTVTLPKSTPFGTTPTTTPRIPKGKEATPTTCAST